MGVLSQQWGVTSYGGISYYCSESSVLLRQNKRLSGFLFEYDLIGLRGKIIFCFNNNLGWWNGWAMTFLSFYSIISLHYVLL